VKEGSVRMMESMLVECHGRSGNGRVVEDRKDNDVRACCTQRTCCNMKGLQSVRVVGQVEWRRKSSRVLLKPKRRAVGDCASPKAREHELGW
jgi:hypothetical protein